MSKFAVVDSEGRLLAFYGEDVHGPRQVEVEVPAAKEGEQPTKALQANPACLIPADAVEISDELWQQWLGRQETAALVDGKLVDVIAKPRTWSWAQIRAKRDRLVVASDWTESPGARVRLGATRSAEWEAYRNALFDIPQKYVNNPAGIVWPVAPGSKA